MRGAAQLTKTVGMGRSIGLNETKSSSFIHFVRRRCDVYSHCRRLRHTISVTMFVRLLRCAPFKLKIAT